MQLNWHLFGKTKRKNQMIAQIRWCYASTFVCMRVSCIYAIAVCRSLRNLNRNQNTISYSNEQLSAVYVEFIVHSKWHIELFIRISFASLSTFNDVHVVFHIESDHFFFHFLQIFTNLLKMNEKKKWKPESMSSAESQKCNWKYTHYMTIKSICYLKKKSMMHLEIRAAIHPHVIAIVLCLSSGIFCINLSIEIVKVEIWNAIMKLFTTNS